MLCGEICDEYAFVHCGCTSIGWRWLFNGNDRVWRSDFFDAVFAVVVAVYCGFRAFLGDCLRWNIGVSMAVSPPHPMETALATVHTVYTCERSERFFSRENKRGKFEIVLFSFSGPVGPIQSL